MPTYVTADQLKRLAPKATNHDALAQAFNETCEKYEINTARRIRYFLTQCLWETEYLTHWSENLYYSTPERLVAVWPSRFTMDKTNKAKAYAPDYVKNPEKLSNLVYANRMGNGSPESGDGYAFRGRGAVHLTGRSSYAEFGKEAYGDPNKFIANPDLVAQPPYNIMSGGWFWDSRKLNQLADADEFTKVTGIVNGSTSTAPARLQLLAQVNSIAVPSGSVIV